MITWDISPELIIGTFAIRLYGLMFAIGITLGAIYLINKARKLEYTDKNIEILIVISFVGIFLGARLVHCLFYDFQYFQDHLLEMILPIATNSEGKWYLSGYHGLASHGGALGLIIALAIFYQITRRNLLPITDILAIATPLVAAFIRFGNLLNSEIVGAPTSLPWAFIFPTYDLEPRHPAQLYEAIFYLILFVIAALLYKKQAYTKLQPGFYVGFIFVTIALFRFLIEYIKEVQVDFENTMTINMGQWLSLPFFIAGIVILLVTQQKNG